MGTASFLDRLRRTGPLRPERAREHGALGPVGKASGYGDDARRTRPYDAYPALGLLPGEPHTGRRCTGPAAGPLGRRSGRVLPPDQAGGRRTVRGRGGRSRARRARSTGGRAAGWAEAPQGEVLYDVRVEDGRIVRCWPRSASFHNLVLFHEVFAGDILTDFPFIEASFGLSAAGVAL